MNFKPKDFLKIIIVLSLSGKLLFVLIFINLNNLEYYEYGELANNLYQGSGYSLLHDIDNAGIDLNCLVEPYISAYMPPGYVFYLYPFFIISDTVLRNLLIIISQILISCLLIFLVYKFTREYFSETSALIAAAITGFLPEFVFASTHIQVTLLYHIGIVTLLLQLYKLNSPKINFNTLIIIGIIFGSLILFRSEVLLFATIIIIYLINKRDFKEAAIIMGIIILIILPWQVRNYVVFDKIIPITTSSGLNLYRGHNPYGIGVWADDSLIAQIRSVRNEEDFEVKMNDIYLENAFTSIKENPDKEIVYPFIKLYNLWIINTSDKRTFNIMYLIPWYVFLLFSVYGLFKSGSWNVHKFSYLYFIFFSVVAIIFFALPRYQTMMKIALVPFAAMGVEMLYYKVKNIIK
jgi:4-amino-4-deoxy-L-arabinose transferase-like glycosyltransferase